MASQKPLPFVRVRVIDDLDPSRQRRNDERRHLPTARVGQPLLFRNPFRTSLPAGQTTTSATLVPDQPTEVLIDAAPREALLEVGTPVRDDEAAGVAGRGPVDLNDEPDDDNHLGRGRDFAGPADPPRAAPVAAIARAVEQAAAMHSMADFVVQTCQGDDKLETGPWQLNLPLDAHGFARCVLQARLSRDLLGLRFLCAVPAQRDLLLRHRQTLQAVIEARLGLPLNIDIALTDD